MRASESDRTIICPASLVRAKTGPRSEKADKAATYGTLVHAWKVDGDTRGSKTLVKKLQAVSIDREKLWPTVGNIYGHETTFSVHLETLQLRIWSPTRSKYSSEHWKRRHPRNSYLTGSIDYLSKRSRNDLPEIPWLDDLKTGSWPVNAKTSLQLRSYAIAPWVLGDCNTDVWVSITQWPKYRLDCRPKRNWHLLKSADIAHHLQKLRWAVRNPDKAIPSENGCRFCLCKPDCNEYQESDLN